MGNTACRLCFFQFDSDLVSMSGAVQYFTFADRSEDLMFQFLQGTNDPFGLDVILKSLCEVKGWKSACFEL